MSFENITVLLADDSMFARKKLNTYIQSLGVSAVYEAADGVEAVEKYKELKPSVVFMDIIMPKKTGILAVTEIMHYDQSAKVVMASSVGTQNHLKEAIAAGAFDFLQKPISDEQIVKILEAVSKGVK